MNEVRETQFADRAARTVVTVAGVALVLAGGWEVTQKVIQVPNIAAALFREETAVRLVDVPQETLRRAPETPIEKPLVEHLTEESDFEVPARPEPEPVPEPEPEPEPVPEPEPIPEPEPEPELEPIPESEPIPEPVPEPEPKPKPKPEPVKPKPQPKPQPKRVEKPKPVEKPAPKPAPAPAVVPSPDAVEGTVAQAGQAGLAEGREGGVGKGVSGSGSGASDGTDQVLAELLAVVEANKTYPRRARQTGQQGEVQLAVEIGPDGRVVSVTIRKKHASALLNRAALKAAEPLEGRPTKLSKAVTIVVPVRFELH